MIPKIELRKDLLEKRKNIPPQRRKEAAEKAFLALKDFGVTLSFSSFGSEIDLRLLNAELKKRGRLYLVPYRLEELIQVPFEKIDCILVPGLAFDKNHFRIGYGKGYYDRFLLQAKNILTIGVGFKEQLYEGGLPTDPWDIPVQQLALF